MKIHIPGSLLIIFICLILLACSRNEKAVDKSFVTDEPCAAPCWYNLELNISSKSDVKANLSELPFILSDSIRAVETGDESTQELEFSCVHSAPDLCGWIVFRNGKLFRISKVVDYPLTLADAVQKIGHPTAVSFLPQVEVPGCQIYLSWPEKKIQVVADIQSACSRYNTPQGLKVDPDLKVNYISYRYDLTDEMVSREGYEPWQGFLEP